jgi:predicted nucleotidyltransferase
MMEAATSPGQVILFGSYARGTADAGSDVDLLVIEREIGDKPGEYMRLRDALGRLAPGIGVDLLICQADDYAQRSLVPGTVFYRARTEGKVLYDALR